jgi:thymidylate synthase (FAD)
MLTATWGHGLNKRHYATEDEQRVVVAKALRGQTLGNALEAAKFTVAYSNISLTTSHQLVRTRVGAAHAQNGGRDNDWRHRAVRIPQTIADSGLRPVWEEAIAKSKAAYAAALDEGMPFQDARFILPSGSVTYLVTSYDYRSLQGLLANRLCLNMQWEIVWCAWELRRLVVEHCPLLGSGLRMPCEIRGHCTYHSNLFEPCGYQPASAEQATKRYEFPITQNGSLRPPIPEAIGVPEHVRGEPA